MNEKIIIHHRRKKNISHSLNYFPSLYNTTGITHSRSKNTQQPKARPTLSSPKNPLSLSLSLSHTHTHLLSTVKKRAASTLPEKAMQSETTRLSLLNNSPGAFLTPKTKLQLFLSYNPRARHYTNRPLLSLSLATFRGSPQSDARYGREWQWGRLSLALFQSSTYTRRGALQAI